MLAAGAGAMPKDVRKQLEAACQGEASGLAQAVLALEAFLFRGGGWSMRLADLEALRSGIRAGFRDSPAFEVLQVLALANEAALVDSGKLRELVGSLKRRRLELALAVALGRADGEISIPEIADLPLRLWLLRLVAERGVPTAELVKASIRTLKDALGDGPESRRAAAFIRTGAEVLACDAEPSARVAALDKLMGLLEADRNVLFSAGSDDSAELAALRIWLGALLDHARKGGVDSGLSSRINRLLGYLQTGRAGDLLLTGACGELGAIDVERNGKAVREVLEKIPDLAQLSFIDRLRVEVTRTRALAALAAQTPPSETAIRKEVLEALRRLEGLIEHGMPPEHRELCQSLRASFVSLYVQASDALTMYRMNLDETLRLLKAHPDDARLATLAVGGALMEHCPQRVKFLLDRPARSEFDPNLLDKLLTVLSSMGIWRPGTVRSCLLAGLARDQIRQVYLRRCSWALRASGARTTNDRLADLSSLSELFDVPALVLSDLTSGAELDAELVFFAALHADGKVALSAARKSEFLSGAILQLRRGSDAGSISKLLGEHPSLWSDATPESMLLILFQQGDDALLSATFDWLVLLVWKLQQADARDTAALRRVEEVLNASEIGRRLWATSALMGKRRRRRKAQPSAKQGSPKGQRSTGSRKEGFWDEHFK